MVDKKLSEFSQITPSEISKLICLFLDQNNAIKNGVVDFQTLDALLMHKSGSETITGDKTFSGDTIFSGNATFNNDINGTIERAKKDGGGNNIEETYTKNTALNNVLTTLYPVGSLYIGTQSSCPLTTLIPGSSWEIVATNKALWGGNGSNANTTIAAGLPNITGSLNTTGSVGDAQRAATSGGSGALASKESKSCFNSGVGGVSSQTTGVKITASSSSSIYGNSSTVQPPAYRVNVWRRTA